MVNNMTASLSSSMANSSMANLANSSMANMANSSMANMANSSMANMANSSMANSSMTNSMTSGFGQKFMTDMWNTQFGLSRKQPSELSPGSRKIMAGLVNPQGQQGQQTLGQMGQQQQNFNIQIPKTRKSMGTFFGEDEDPETSSYFQPQATSFRSDKDILGQPNSPSQNFNSGNFYSQGGLNNFGMPQQRGPISATHFQRNNAPTPTSINPNFPVSLQPNSPNRGVISAIGQPRVLNTTQTSQPMSSLQKRPIGSGLPSSSSSGFPSLAFPPIRGSETSQPNFDLSDFPSLGNRGQGQPPSTSLSGTVSGSLVGSVPPTRNYVGMVSKPVQDQTPEFQIQQEDFPALPGAQSTLSIFVSDPPTSGTSDQTKKQPINLISGSSYDQVQNKENKFNGEKVSAGLVRKGVQAHPDGRVTNIPPGMVADQFGIVGLLTFIKAAETDPNLVALAPGMDLTTLGLNLNSPENLYSTFQSPWVDLPCRPQDIDFHVPAEYLTNIFIRDKLAPIKLNRYGEDLLFFLFYMNGGDVLQLAAAAELYNRDWRYHKEERVWITRAPGVEPVMKTNTFERGTYYFFDAQNWRKVAKEFYLEYDKLEERPTLPPTLHHNPNQPISAH